MQVIFVKCMAMAIYRRGPLRRQPPSDCRSSLVYSMLTMLSCFLLYFLPQRVIISMTRTFISQQGHDQMKKLLTNISLAVYRIAVSLFSVPAARYAVWAALTVTICEILNVGIPRGITYVFVHPGAFLAAALSYT